jgi:ribosomal protein S18 acetylase RimI-like enzyme
VCPIFRGEHLYLSVGAHTPKARDLRERSGWALHAFLGESDEELQLSGQAAEVHDAGERAAVHDAIPFAAFQRDDPIFRLDLERALWVHWERAGQPDTVAVRRRWPDAGRRPEAPGREAAATPVAIGIEPYDEAKLGEIVELSLRAWAPVFASIELAMGSEIFREQHPDWRETQRRAVEATCTDDDVHTFVASQEGRTVGFVALRRHAEDRMGEIYMIAVDPDFQRRGIAGALTRHSLDWLARAGMTTAMVETGGDPGHAPARRTYESAGFRLVPVARYFKKL